MSEQKPPIGSIGWKDLTVPNAEEVKNFYCEVVGWKAEAHNMGEYDDYVMMPDSGEEPAGGICHARGTNANIPPQWLIYITVADVNQSAKRCVELGGKIIDGPRKMGGNNFCVIQDPAGEIASFMNNNHIFRIG